MLILRPIPFSTALSVIALTVMVACSSPTPNHNGPKKVLTPSPGLHNLIRATERVYSGGEPQGNVGFDSLKSLGIKTIVSVDGARPNLPAAKARGMRYIHIPIGYDGIPEQAALALTRVLHDIEGPVYFHCHHGKHRGPAAVAIACIGAGAMKPFDGEQLMRKAGTGTAYTGLWRDVAAYSPPSSNAKFPKLVEVAEVPDFAAAMAGMSRTYDNLELCQKAGWKTPPDHPDISPNQEALLLWEAIRESRRKPFEGGKEDFHRWMAESEALALRLREALSAQSPTDASHTMEGIRQSCKQCHKVYRNTTAK